MKSIPFNPWKLTISWRLAITGVVPKWTTAFAKLNGVIRELSMCIWSSINSRTKIPSKSSFFSKSKELEELEWLKQLR